MTIHITTITPNHIVSVSDRLIATSAGYRELDNDKYKHLILLTDDARAIVTFAGLAGVVGADRQLGETTIDWLTGVIGATSSERKHGIDEHLTDVRDNVERYIDKLRMQGLRPSALRLAIQVSGWAGSEQFNCVIDNCLDINWGWQRVARASFKTRLRKYGDANFEDGSYVSVLGRKDLAITEPALFQELTREALHEQPKRIFEACVRIIRAVALVSRGSVGVNCSGVRMSRNDPGIEVYSDRDTTVYDTVMPNCIISKSGISYSTTNFRGRSTAPNPRPLRLRIPVDKTTFHDRLYFAECVREKLRREHNSIGQQYREGKISEAEWRRYIDRSFRPKNTAVSECILAIRAEVKTAARALPDDSTDLREIDLPNVFEEKADQGTSAAR